MSGRFAGASLAAMLVLAACGSEDGGGAKPAQPDQPPVVVAEDEPSSGPQPVTPTDLDPGTYVAEEFEVPFTFTVDAGWRVFESEDRVLTPGREGEGLIAIATYDEVYDPQNVDRITSAPKDTVGFLSEHPMLEVTSSTPITIGGVQGEVLEITGGPGIEHELCDSACVPLLPVFAESFGIEFALTIGEGQEKRFIAADVDGHPILMYYEDGTSDAFVEQFENEFLGSVEWA